MENLKLNDTPVRTARNFAINNIDTTQHIATYGTPERLIEDKTSFDRFKLR